MKRLLEVARLFFSGLMVGGALCVSFVFILLMARSVASQAPLLLFVSGSSGATPAASTLIGFFPVSTTTTARNIVGGLVAEKSSRWTVVSAPAVSNQATASLAAEAAVRHVADCVTFSAGSTTAPALTNLTINLRDGATGAGTVIASWDVVIPAATGQNVAPFGVCGLNLVGTTNTAMTLEFSALLTNLLESVTLTGFNLGS